MPIKQIKMNKIPLKTAGCLLLTTVALVLAITAKEILFNKLFSAGALGLSVVTYKLLITTKIKNHE